MEGQNTQVQNTGEPPAIVIDEVQEDEQANLATQENNTPAPADPNNEPAPVDNRPNEEANPPAKDENNTSTEENGSEENEDQQGIISTIRDKIGTNLDVEQFEETEEGVAQFATRAAEEIAKQEFERIINSDQLVKDVIEYQRNGGDPRQILYAQYPEKDYTQIELENDNPDQHKQIIRDYYKYLGENEQDIQDLVNDLEQAGKLSERAEKFLNKLSEAQKDQAKKLKQQQEQEEKQRLEEAKQFWDGIWNDLSKKTAINGIQIPETEKRPFFEYISNPVTQDGMAKADVDRQNREIDTQMMHDYIDYLANVKGLTLQQLIKRSTNTGATRTLRQKLNQENENNKSRGINPGDESNGQTGNEEPDLDSMYIQTQQQ